MNEVERLSQIFLDGDLTDYEYQIKLSDTIQKMDTEQLITLSQRLTYNE